MSIAALRKKWNDDIQLLEDEKTDNPDQNSFLEAIQIHIGDAIDIATRMVSLGSID